MSKNKTSEKIIVGLDVGTTKICAMVANVTDENNINIIGIGKAPSKGLDRGVVINPKKATESIKTALLNAEKNSGISIQSVTVGVSGHHVRCILSLSTIGVNNPDGTIHQEDVDRVLEQAQVLILPKDTQIIHVIPQEYIINDKIKVYESPVGNLGIKLEAKVNVVTGLVSDMEHLSQCVADAGVDVDDVVLEPIASAMAVLDDTEKKVGIAMIDIGGGTTDIAVFKKGVLKHTASIGLAGKSVTNDIIEGLGILEDEAEEVKKENGYALISEILNDDDISVKIPNRQSPKKYRKSTLARIINARMQELLGLCLLEIKNSQIYNELFAGVKITGGGSLLKGTKELAELIFKTDVSFGKPKDVSGGLLKEVQNPIYATALGLILYSLKNSDIKNEGPLKTKASKNKKEKDKLSQRLKELFNTVLKN